MKGNVDPPSVGFVGFGEAGSTIAKGLRSAGITSLAAYDIAVNDTVRGPHIHRNAVTSGATLVDSPGALARQAEIIFSAVTAASAREAAEQLVPYLRPRHVFVDINSVSPSLKQELSRIVEPSGAGFVEAAVMAPVSPYGHKVPILLGGNAAAAFAARMTAFGMSLEVLSTNVGTAAAVKMCRSIVVKGLEALLLECVLAAGRYGAEEQVFRSLQESYPGLDWPKLANYALNRVVVHGERRAHEMEEVAQTLRAAGIEPLMAEATARRQNWSAEMKLKSKFAVEGPSTYREVLDALDYTDPEG